MSGPEERIVVLEAQVRLTAARLRTLEAELRDARCQAVPQSSDVMQVPAADAVRFWSKADRSDPDGCWPWTAAVLRDGYGIVMWRGRSTTAHRVAYELLVGPIPNGLVLDHTCHTPSKCAGGITCQHRRCVNPAHLEAVTSRENTMRGCTPKTHCPAGHPYSGTNLKVSPSGGRFCRACHRISGQRAYAAKKLAKSGAGQ